ncbi:MAG: ABC transporter ATP-binding protein [Planctomycetes bacterium]|nr:ABC transporter ATP-binding protein [Planctomycetota bacterium]
MAGDFISLKDVRFHYEAGHVVLEGLNFELEADQRVHLAGANGSGKTTVLHLIVGLLQPEAGEVVVLGKARRRETDFDEVRGKVGLVFQDAEDQLFCPTVLEDVAFGPMNLGKSRQETREIVARTLESLGLGGYEERITHKLSGGEKRLVSLACVLAMEPEILLLDEPTAGLDDDIMQRIIGILTGLKQPMVIVSHDREFVEAVTNVTVTLSEGKFKG